MKENRSLLEIRKKLSHQLLEAHELRPPQGLPTGLQQLDEFLSWGGLPEGHISLFKGPVGAGRTSLWLQTAEKLLNKGKWCCWIGLQHRFFPGPKLSKSLALSRLLVLHPPPESRKVLFSINQVCSSQIFDLIGVETDFLHLRPQDGALLRKQARQSQVTLVFVDEKQTLPLDHFALSLEFRPESLVVHRALHRPTPQLIKRGHHESSRIEAFKPALVRNTG